MTKLKNLINKIWWIPTVAMIPSFATFSAIEGRSMSPTLNPNTDKCRDIVLVLKTKQVERNKIYLLTHPNNPNLTLIKRIVGEETDLFWFGGKSVNVPEGAIWVESDEPYRGNDSRSFGPIPIGLLIGKATAVVWPLNRIQWL
ncbi:peptidase S24/S26A/S26B/S26C [Globomyces pollinis-pini]|nr:peptidase S24/S26A/S26B/S26C [Globomyces pollinis-pini]